MGSIANHYELQKPKVYVLNPYHKEAIKLLQSNPQVEIILPSDPNRSDWIKDATALLIRSETRLSRDEIIQAPPTLKYVVKQGAGIDNVDISEAEARGIQVLTTPGLNSEAVAELTIALALCIARRVCEMDRMLHNETPIIRSQYLGQSLYGKVLGVIGMGNIGLQVAQKWASAMHGQIVAYDPYLKDAGTWNDVLTHSRYTRCDELDELLKAADVVTLHIPLTNSTRDFISTRELQLMKPTAILLNCARGGVVNESALLHALQTEQTFGAGLDAVEHEPPTVAQYEAHSSHTHESS